MCQQGLGYGSGQSRTYLKQVIGPAPPQMPFCVFFLLVDSNGGYSHHQVALS